MSVLSNIALAILLLTASHIGVRAQPLPSLSIEIIRDLQDLGERWQALQQRQVSSERSPFSRAGIEIIATRLAESRSLEDTADRRETFERLRSGHLELLVPQERLTAYCLEINRVQQSNPLALALPSEVVHAATVIPALALELPAVLRELDLGPSRMTTATATQIVESALNRVLERQRAVALIDILVNRPRLSSNQIDDLFGAVGLPRDARSILERLRQRLAAQPPQVRLCRETNAPAPQLPPSGGIEALRDWAEIKATVDGFIARRSVDIDRRLALALEQVAALPAADLLVEHGGPAGDITIGAAAAANPDWRLVFVFRAPSRDATLGELDLELSHTATRRRIPLGITVRNVTHQRSGSSAPEARPFIFRPVPLIQNVRVDTSVVERAFHEAGMPRALGLTRVSVDISEDLGAISLHIGVEERHVGSFLEHSVALFADHRPTSVSRQLADLAREVAKSIQPGIARWMTSTVRAAWGGTSLTQIGVTAEQPLRHGPWQLVARAMLPMPLDGQSAQLEFALDPGARGFLRLHAAVLPHQLERRLIERLRSVLAPEVAISLLPGLQRDALPFLAECVEIRSVRLIQDEESRIQLEANFASRGDEQVWWIRVLPTVAGSAESLGVFFAAASQALIGCATERFAAASARARLGLSPADVGRWAADLRRRQVDVLGVALRIENLRPPAGNRAFSFDLVAEFPSARLGTFRLAGAELRSDRWRPGQPLTLDMVDISAAAISPADIRSLLLHVAGIPEGFVGTVGIRLLPNGAVGVQPQITVSALGAPIDVPEISVRLDGTASSFRNSIVEAAKSALQQSLSNRLAALFPDLGALQSVQLDPSSVLIPIADQNFKVIAHVRATLPLIGEVPWTVTIELNSSGRPNLSVSADPRSIAIGALTQAITGPLQERLKGLGVVPGGVTNVQILTSPPYGVSFTATLDVAAFKVELEGVRITRDGLDPPPTVTVVARTPIIASPFQAMPFSLTYDFRRASDFRIRGTVTLNGDSFGVVAIDAQLLGEAGRGLVTADGVLRVAGGVPLARVDGVADFRQALVTLESRTIGPLARYVDLGQEVRIHGGERRVEIGMRLDALGADLNGTLLVDGSGNGPARVSLGANARLPIGVRETRLDAVLAPNLRATGISGNVRTIVGNAALRVTPATASLALEFMGVRIRLITPSLGMLQPHLLEEAIERILDFRLSLNNITSREIVISLVGSDGRPDTSELGGDRTDGRPADDDGHESEAGQPRSAPAPSSAAMPSATKQPRPSPSTPGGEGGSPSQRADAITGCGPRGAEMRMWPATFPGYWVEGVPGRNAQGRPVIFISSNARVASDTSWRRVSSGSMRSLACFDDLSLPDSPALTGTLSDQTRIEIRSSVVHVFAADNDDKLYFLIWRRDHEVRELHLSADLVAAAFRGRSIRDLAPALRAGWRPRHYARTLLRRAVAASLEGPERWQHVAAFNTVGESPAAGLPDADGVFIIERMGDRRRMSLLLPDGDDNILSDPYSPGVTDGQPLFALAASTSEADGPAKRLIASAARAGLRLQVAWQADRCRILSVDSISGTAQRTDGIFVLVGEQAVWLEFVASASARPALRRAYSDGAGERICAVAAEGRSAGWTHLAADFVRPGAIALAFGRNLDQPDWSVRFVAQSDSGSPFVEPRNESGASLTQRLQLWASRGEAIDPALGSQQQLLRTMLERRRLVELLVMPERGWIGVMSLNPRGLMP